MLLNGVSDSLAIDLSNQSVSNIYCSGKVTNNIAREFNATCLMDLTRFPFDSQNCTLIFENFDLAPAPDEQLQFSIPPNASTVNTDFMTQSDKFTLVGSSFSVGLNTLKYFGVGFPYFGVTLGYTRYPCYYLANVVVPGALLLCKQLIRELSNSYII